MEHAVVEMPEISGQKWECRDCHRHILDSETFAYHLINRILCGWCEGCFNCRSASNAEGPVSRAAAVNIGSRPSQNSTRVGSVPQNESGTERAIQEIFHPPSRQPTSIP